MGELREVKKREEWPSGGKTRVVVVAEAPITRVLAVEKKERREPGKR